MDLLIIFSVLIFLIVIIRKAFRNSIPSNLQYSLWIIPVFYILFSWIISFWRTESIIQRLYYSKYMNAKTYLTRILNTVIFNVHTTNVKLDEIGLLSGTEVTVWKFLLVLWLFGALFVAGLYIFKSIRIRKFVSSNSVYEGENDPDYKGIVFVKHLPYPFLFGSKIYIDSDERDNRERLNYIISHERNHQRQGDVIWNFLRTVSVIVFWFNPLVWLAAFLSKTDSEYSCDEKTTKKMSEYERKAYGMTLLELSAGDHIDKNIKKYFSSSVLGGDLKSRVEKILGNKAKISFSTVGLCITASTILLLVAILFFPHTPIELQASGISKRVNEYINLPIMNDFEEVNVQYNNQKLYVTLNGKTQDIFEIHDKWLEKESAREYFYVFQNNLQGNENSSIRFWGVNTKAKEDMNCSSTWISLLEENDNIDRRLFYTLTENFEKNYPSLEPGLYRMTYVVSAKGTKQKELIQVLFSVENG